MSPGSTRRRDCAGIGRTATAPEWREAKADGGSPARRHQDDLIPTAARCRGMAFGIAIPATVPAAAAAIVVVIPRPRVAFALLPAPPGRLGMTSGIAEPATVP